MSAAELKTRVQELRSQGMSLRAATEKAHREAVDSQDSIYRTNLIGR